MSKKIMIWSVNPKVNTGYGVATKSIIKILKELNYNVVVQASYGNYGFIDYLNDTKILPALSPKKYGADIILQNIEAEKPDMILQLFDLFAALDLDKIKIPIASLLMVDSMPYQNCNNYNLKYIKTPCIVVESAKKAINKKYLQKEPIYCPLPISSNYYIEDKIKSIEYFNSLIGNGNKILDNDDILITVVSNNCGVQDRKNIKNILRSYPIVKKLNKKIKLYLHMDITGQYSGGEYLYNFIDDSFSEEDKKLFSDVYYPSPLRYYRAEYTQDDMRYIYNSSTIYLNPCMSEGFGMPLIESLSCGVEPLTTNFLATKEIVENCTNPKYHLLDGDLVDVGFGGRRMNITEDTIANGILNLIDNLTPNLSCSRSYSSKKLYCESNLLENYDKVIKETL